MLTEQRYEKILNLLEQKKSVTVVELKELLDTSESTIRRDLNALDRAGKLVKVFGGAVSAGADFISEEPSVEQKIEICFEEKQRIGAICGRTGAAGRLYLFGRGYYDGSHDRIFE